MKVICCISHLYIPTTIMLINNYGVDNTIIFTDQPSIKDCLSLIYPTINIHLEKASHDSWLLNLYEHKNSIDKFVNNNSFDEVFFFHEGFGDCTNYFLLRVGPNAKKTYIPLYKSFDYNKLDRIIPLKLFIKETIRRIVWGYSFGYCQMYSKKMPVLKKTFFDKIGNSEGNVSIDEELIQSIISSKILTEETYPSKSCVLLAPNGFHGESLTQNKQELVEIEKIIVKNAPFVLLKKHPRLDLIKNDIEKQLLEIPSFITGSLILTRFKCFVGISSTVLSDASKLGIPSISIIDLLKENIDEPTRKGVKEMFCDLGTPILFPQTLEELGNVLKNIYHEQQ